MQRNGQWKVRSAKQEQKREGVVAMITNIDVLWNMDQQRKTQEEAREREDESDFTN